MSAGEATGRARRGCTARSTTDELLAEAQELARQLRETYLANSVIGRSAPAIRLQQVAKVGELTALLGHCTAWLSTRKAVESGELAAADGRRAERRLGGRARPAGEPDAEVPQSLASLDRRVQALHARLARLDRLLDQAG